MEHNFDLDGVFYHPLKQEEQQQVRPTNLPLWRDEDHMPPPEAEKEEPKAEPVTASAGGMTAEAAKQKLCLWAQSQIGYHEGSNNQNRYADTPGLSEMYGWRPQNQPWCDVFVDAGFISCFGVAAACAMTYQPMGAGSALCRQSAQYYKDAGAWFTRPEIGDQIFFYASGDINHTGIVVGVDGGSVITVEGNSSDQVAERVYSISDTGRIAGYGRPNWAAASGTVVDDCKDTNSPANEQESQKESRYFELCFPYLRRGSTGAAVIAVQFLLMGQGYSVGPDGADGDYGGNTEEAVKDFQAENHLTPDGIVGPATAARLFGGEVIQNQPQPEQETKTQDTAPETTQDDKTGILNKFKKLWRKE